MKNQIIKSKIDFLNEFIINIGTIESNRVVINETNYNKAKYNGLIQPFLLKLYPFYHTSKLFYINREITYTGFITILRQICKKNEVLYESKIKYTKSTHYLEYYFHVLI